MKNILLQKQAFNESLCISCVSELLPRTEKSGKYFWQKVSRTDSPLPKDAACKRQFPSPVVAKGRRRLQLVHTVDHQFSRPEKKASIKMVEWLLIQDAYCVQAYSNDV